jgi:hypothetical protein
MEDYRKPRELFFLVLAIGGLSALMACRAFRSLPEAQGASLPMGAGSPSAANAKLEKAVKSMFERDEQVRSANIIVRADVTKNEVTLSGPVESEAVRSRAVELAKIAQVGVLVNDQMTVISRGGGR